MKIRLSTYILTENLKNIDNIFRIVVTILLVIVRLTLKEQHGGKQFLLLIKCNIKSVCVVSDWWIYNCALLHKERLSELKDASIEMCVSLCAAIWNAWKDFATHRMTGFVQKKVRVNCTFLADHLRHLYLKHQHQFFSGSITKHYCWKTKAVQTCKVPFIA